MTKRSTGEEEGDELPPGWTWLHATTPGGVVYVAVWREFPDMTQFELDCAIAAPLGSPPSLPGLAVARVKSSWTGYAVATVRAQREARGGRPDLPEDDWQRLLHLVHPTLSVQERLNPKEILTAIAVLRPPRGADAVAYAPPVRRGPGRPGWTETLFLERWHEAESKAAPSDRLADIAAVFRARDGKVGGIGIHSLRRLLRRFTT